MSDRDLARHRAPQRPLTPLSDFSEAFTGRLTLVGRSSAVLAVSTGLIATAGMPTQAEVTGSRSTALTSTDTSSMPVLTAGSANRPVSAPSTASVEFEADAFAAVRAVPRRRVAPPPRATPTPEPSTTAGRTVTPPKVTSSRAAGKVKAPPPRRTPTASTHTTAPVSTGHAATHPGTGHSTTAPAKTGHTTTGHATTGHASTARHVVPPPESTRHLAPPTKKKTPKPEEHTTHSTAPASSVRGSSVLAIAARYVGTPYVYGGTTPRGFDCSGYVGYVYRQLGMSLPRTANQQMLASHRIARSQARPGDLIFFLSGHHAYHVAIYAGGRMMYDSPHTGARVSKRAIWGSNIVFGRFTH